MVKKAHRIRELITCKSLGFYLQICDTVYAKDAQFFGIFHNPHHVPPVLVLTQQVRLYDIVCGLFCLEVVVFEKDLAMLPYGTQKRFQIMDALQPPSRVKGNMAQRVLALQQTLGKQFGGIDNFQEMKKGFYVHAVFIVNEIAPAGMVVFELYPEFKANLLHIALNGAVSYLEALLVKEVSYFPERRVLPVPDLFYDQGISSYFCVF